MNFAYVSALIVILGSASIVHDLLRHGAAAMVSMKSIGTVFIIIGFAVSPLLHVVNPEGPWDSFLLFPEHLLQSQLFAAAGLAAHLLAFMGADNSGSLRKYLRWSQSMSATTPLVVTVSVIVAMTIHTGGIDQLINASVTRGSGQFDQRVGLLSKIQHICAIYASLAGIIGSVLVGTWVVTTRLSAALTYPIALGLLFGCSLPYFWVFSRAAGAGVFVFSATLVMLGARARFPIAAIGLLLAVHLGQVGLDGRSHFSPGVGNYLTALFDPVERSKNQDEGVLPAPSDNYLDAVPSFTAKVAVEANVTYERSALIGAMLVNLGPFPSELAGSNRVGNDLAEALGTHGHTGLPTPSWAELYFVMGYAGALVVLAISLACRWIEQRARNLPPQWAIAMILLATSHFPISLHSTLRASTRPILYAIVGILVFKFLDLHRQHRRQQPQPIPPSSEGSKSTEPPLGSAKRPVIEP